MTFLKNWGKKVNMEKTLDNTIDRLLSKIDIVDVISSYLPLKQAGRNLKTNCPFHNEKTPSFVVSPEKQIFHCFGCHVGGNAISFVSKHEAISFYEALKKLAKQYNIDLPQTYYKKTNKSLNKAEDLLTASANLYYKCLTTHKLGAYALEYFKKRNITLSTIKQFKLGFAPNSWDTLIKAAFKKKYTKKDLLSAGLILEKNNKIYDRFRNRIIFPIYNITGNVIGFGARVLDKSLPKYINSPDSPVFNKSNNLYGLNITKKEVLKQNEAILVEGYMDCIKLFQEGFKNVVATLGTSLTENHVKILKRYTSNILIIFDSDEAGIKACSRNIELFLKQDLFIKILTFKDVKDPDEFLEKFGKEKLKAYINKNAKSFFDFKLEQLQKQYNINDSNGKSKIANEIIKMLNHIQDAILKDEYLKKLSNVLNIEFESIKTQIKKNKVYSKKDSSADISLKDLEKKDPKTLNLIKAEHIITQLLIDKNKIYCIIKDLAGLYNLKFITNELNLVLDLIKEKTAEESFFE